MTILALPAILLVANLAAGQQPARAGPTGSRWPGAVSSSRPGRSASELLVEMNPLLESHDPVLRDDVAYGAAERWIVREHRLSPSELRTLLQLWTANLDDHLGEAGDDRVFKRSFSALCLSLVAATDLSAPFLDPPELQAFFDRMLTTSSESAICADSIPSTDGCTRLRTRRTR